MPRGFTHRIQSASRPTPSRSACRFRRAAVLGLGFTLAAGMLASAGDLLRGGAGAGSRSANARPSANTDAASEQARANAKDALARTTQAIQSMQRMQQTAREIAVPPLRDPSRPGLILPTVPNGLKPGGLEVAPGVPKNLAKPQAGEDLKLWQGAKLPVQSQLGGETLVTVEQLSQQAILTWRTFNIGKGTRLRFNQGHGGAQKSEWIAFNKIEDPTGSPTQILGKIEAPGQVYVINRNGIIFGNTSQINVHSLVASSLPINDALIGRGLLNQEKGNVRFLFSSTLGDPVFQLAGGATTYTLSSPVAAGTTPTLSYTDANGTTKLTAETDYTLAKDPTGKTVATFTPAGLAKVGASPIKVAYAAETGDVTVLPGAILTSPTTPAHVGGRIALVGTNVNHGGTISTPDGQTILAAGREVGFAAHPSADPSLRGLDVYVGNADARSGVATNSGLIDAPRANVTIAGKTVEQMGVIDSSTTVSLNGRIDLIANYGATTNPAFDPTAGFSPFLFRNTGLVTMGPGSVTQILPELESEETAVGTELALRSQINVQGRVIHLASNSSVLAPNAKVGFKAGTWNFLAGSAPTSNFVTANGQIYLDSGASINVAGTPDVSVPIAQNLLTLQMRGSEFADSSLQRDGLLRGIDITIDLRNQGTFNGLAWVGTPLGDATGFAGLVQRSVGQLTTAGGNVELSAGSSVVLQPGSKIDVSGGWINFEGGMIKTTRVLSGGQLLDISQATPDRVYDGIYTGTFTDTRHAKYGITLTYNNPLALTGGRFEPTYVQGADGGKIAITAPSMALDGQLFGAVTAGPRQQQTPAAGSELSLAFQGQTAGDVTETVSPTPPRITFQNAPMRPADAFALNADGTPKELRKDRLEQVTLSPELLSPVGFGKLTVDNSEGDIAVPATVEMNTPVGGSIVFKAANIDIQGKLKAPSGTLSFTAYNYSPFLPPDTTVHDPFPAIRERGIFTLGAGAELDASGLIVDNSRNITLDSPVSPDGGTISVTSYTADLQAGSTIDVSGGLTVSGTGKRTYGNAGSISISAGQDPGQGRGSVLGGHLTLEALLKGYSGAKGGSLAIRAPLIQIGGRALHEDTLLLSPAFFNTGGFTSFALTGLGASTENEDEFLPGVLIAPGTTIAPVAQSWLALPNAPGSEQTILSPILLQQSLRTPVSLSFSAPGVTRPDGTLLIRGNFVMGQGSAIITDPKASVSLDGQTAAILGQIIAPAGSISITGASSYPLLSGKVQTEALPTVYLGPSSVLSTAGVTMLVPDAFGRRVGSVLNGGTISVAGNIVAQKGGIMDVSGTSGIFDLHPSVVAEIGAVNGQIAGAPIVPFTSGINTPLWSTSSVPVRIDSDGGTITLKGAQELFVDSTLLGRAGGPAGQGGTLIVSSNRFYGPNDAAATPADLTLAVTQGGLTRPQISYGPDETAIGRVVLGKDGKPLTAMGYFTANTFSLGGFDSLSLGGNVQFRGPVSIHARRDLAVASGGVLSADAPVQLFAAHAILGTPFLPPVAAGQQASPYTLNGQPFYIPPTFGSGRLSVTADLIEIGNLSLANIGKASLIADHGDIRGDGTFDMAGDLYLRAGQIYPVSGTQFNIAAYDYQFNGATRAGSITIAGSGHRDLPLSAGGQLSLYASNIEQGGTLRAPAGTIQIGWEDAATAPLDLLSGVRVPIAQQVTLTPGSITSVSLVDAQTGSQSIIPYGLSTDGASWIDPTGTDIAAGKLPMKEISIGGLKLSIQTGSTIDISGGGDLYAYRFVKGNGGSTDLLSWNFTGTWKSGTIYKETQIVSYKGAFYYARTDLPADAAALPPTPGANWRQVQQTFAVIPGYQADYAPYGAFSGGTDPGYVQNGLNVGDKIYLGASKSLAAGTYTLLPARYALLPGAVLVTPQAGAPVGTFDLPDGGRLVSGYRYNSLNDQRDLTPIYSRFEVAGHDVFRARAQYEDYFANEFLTQRALLLGVNLPRLPADAGYLRLVARNALVLNGNVLALGQPRFHNGLIDIASTSADILVAGSNITAGANQIVLDAARLSGFKAESLVIGGVRDFTANGVKLTVLTDNVTVDNAGSPLRGSEIILAAKKTLTLEEGAMIVQIGEIGGYRSDPIFVGDKNTLGSGDGVLLRVSSDRAAQVIRQGVDTTNLTPTLTVKAGAMLSGTSLILDSTAATSLDSKAKLDADYLSLASGQIILQLDPNVAVPNTGLVLGGALLKDLSNTKSLSLLTYRSLDLYGSGDLLVNGALALHAAEIRGFDNGGGISRISAGSITLDNRSGTTGPGADPALGGALSGTLELNSSRFRFGEGALAISQFQLVDVNASGGLLFTGSGGVTTKGDFQITTPFVTATQGISNGITAVGDLTFDTPAAGPTGSGGGLGATLVMKGASVLANSNFTLHSGALTLQATGSDPTDGVTIGGRIDTSGTAQTFFDVTRFTNGGAITLISKSGDITVGADALLDVSASPGGGDAGGVAISVPQGSFLLGGKMVGRGGTGGKAGSFSLDVKELASTAAVASTLDAGGFTESQAFRVRTGDVTINSTSTAHTFRLSADGGGITVTGTIDASGITGGRIDLIASGDLTLLSGAVLDASGEKFSSAGKGGAISLEAGAQINGVADYSGGAMLDIQSGSTIDLSVAEVNGIADPVAQAVAVTQAQALGQFTGTLHLRAPQTADALDVNIAAIGGTVTNASKIVVEGYRLFDLQQGGQITNSGAIQALGGVINAGVNVQGSVRANGQLFGGNSTAISDRLFAGGNASLADVAVIAPGAEIINRFGDVSLGTASTTTSAADWDLSTYRFGPKAAPGVLTIRAANNLTFFNALSDGFASSLYTAQLMAANPLLAANAQSWSYRLTAGADVTAADFHLVLPKDEGAPGNGSILVGKTLTPTGSTTAQVVPRLFQVIRTGSGDIDLAARGDVVLRNLFSNIYTAGTRLSDSEVAMGGTFELPRTKGGYTAQYSLGGGDVTIAAQGDIRREAILPTSAGGSQNQLPMNWLYRRGATDPETGAFIASPSGFSAGTFGEIASTSWWIDYSNFFEGVGALGGGNVSLLAGGNITNVDAVIPTNARMPGKDTLGNAIAPDASQLIELGGGSLTVRAGQDIDGGVYYVERGAGSLQAGRDIKTNATRNTSTANDNLSSEDNWLPTTLFLGKGSFDVNALGNINLGPVANPFLLPLGFSNSFSYKTYFSTYATTNAVNVQSTAGSVTLRQFTTPPEDGSIGTSVSILQQWMKKMQLTATANTGREPWLNLAETDLGSGAFSTAASLMPATLKVTAFSGDINLVGKITLSPSPTGTIELIAGRSINGLQPDGAAGINGLPVTVWSAAQINLSDADPASVPSPASPLAFQNFVLSQSLAQNENTLPDFFKGFSETFTESGSTNNSFSAKQTLHGSSLLHGLDPEPIRLYAIGDLSDLTLFSAKPARIVAGHDINDISFYLQNLAATDVSLVAAGRDIIAYNANSPLRAASTAAGNYLAGTTINLATGETTIPDSEAGDIQIGGPGALEVLAGRNLDLGAGENRPDGTGTGIISIGNGRNPNLPSTGANLIGAAGIGASSGLSESTLDFEGFSEDGFEKYAEELAQLHPEFVDIDPKELSEEQRAILATDILFLTLRDAGRAQTGPTTAGGAGFEDAYAAIDSLFGRAGKRQQTGNITTQGRDFRTRNGGNISLLVPHGKLTLGTTSIGNPQIPPGIVTEAGGAISIFAEGDVDIGISRIFTLRGGNIIIWSTNGDIAAGSSSKTVKSAPPTRVLIDLQSADVKTDLAGLATGGGIGVLATVQGVSAGDVDLIAPKGVVDAGDAGIRSTGNLNIAATAVLNASNITVAGTSSGVPASAPSSVPSPSVPAGATNSTAAANNASEEAVKQARNQATDQEEAPSIITVEVVDYNVEAPTSSPPAAVPSPPPTPEQEEEERRRKRGQPAPAAVF